MKTLLSFDDVILVPQYSEIESRGTVDTSTILKVKSGNHIKLDVPLISSPMPAVTETMMAYHMYLNGGLGILHRFNTIEQQVQMVKDFFDLTNQPLGDVYGVDPVIGAAVGINGDYLERVNALISYGVRVICIDVAHGYHKNVGSAMQNIAKMLPDHIHLMVGNIGDVKGYKYLNNFQIPGTSCRQGISGGSACETFSQTGHGYPTFQSVYECAQSMDPSDNNMQLIADGGIRNSGDVVKSIAGGATACILGSLLAGSKAAPGIKETNANGVQYKTYYGSASERAQLQAGKKEIRSEGASSIKLLYTGKLENTISNLKKGIQSGYSYSGATNMTELQENAEFALLTHSSLIQSLPHGKMKSIEN